MTSCRWSWRGDEWLKRAGGHAWGRGVASCRGVERSDQEWLQWQVVVRDLKRSVEQCLKRAGGHEDAGEW